MNYIKEFKIYLENSRSLRYKISLIGKDNKELNNIDFIEVSQELAIRILKAQFSIEHIRLGLLDIINSIYFDHLKYKLTNTSYPLYKIEYHNGRFIVELGGFKQAHNELSDFVTPEYVDIINLITIPFIVDDTGEVVEKLSSFRLNDEVRVVSILNYNNYKLLNTENIGELNANALIKVVNQASRYNGGILEFNRVRHIDNCGIYDFTSIFKIYFNDGCQINSIGDRWILSFKNLQEIRLCKSLKYIGNYNINSIITNIDGQEYISIHGKNIKLLR
ncbi:MAG: hypothetical protein J6A59_17900 [Lachnospiraceae bacterium]|nr:hypothetical protein [Lachnospiraceae bacterium]